MPDIMRYVEESKRQELLRHNSTEHRSQTKTSRLQSPFVPGPVSSVYPFGRTHPNCCHISDLHQAKQRLSYQLGDMSKKFGFEEAQHDAQLTRILAKERRLRCRRLPRLYNCFLTK